MRRTGHFHCEWLRNPLQVGAIAPFSASPGATIMQGLGPEGGHVLDLGPGTDVFRAVTERGVPAVRITAMEASNIFATSLTQVSPEVHVHREDASRLRKLLPRQDGTVKTVVCGLALLSMPVPKMYRIMHDSFQLLTDNGKFRLFTYGPNCLVPDAILRRLQLGAQRSDFVLMNLPPASVCTLTRRSIA